MAGGGHPAPAADPLADFDAALNKFKDHANTVSIDEIKEISKLVLDGFGKMKVLVALTKSAKKPEKDDIKQI